MGRNTALTALVGLGFGLIIWDHPPSLNSTLQVAGLCLFVAGFILWAMARLQLGESFAVRAQAKRLVSHGLYSKIRNPIYIFGSCVIGGLILLFGHPKWLLVFVVIIPLQVWRAHREAAVLEAKFGERYRAYRASTWL